MVTIFECADTGNHSSIVGGITEPRNIDGPTKTTGMFLKSIAKTSIGRNSAGHSHMGYASLPYSLAQFVHQYIYYCSFETGGDILFMIFHKVGLIFYPFTQII